MIYLGKITPLRLYDGTTAWTARGTSVEENKRNALKMAHKACRDLQELYNFELDEAVVIFGNTWQAVAVILQDEYPFMICDFILPFTTDSIDSPRKIKTIYTW